MTSPETRLPNYAQVLKASADAHPGEYPAYVEVRDKENGRVVGRYGRSIEHACDRVRAQLGGRFQEIDEDGGAA